MLAHARRLTGLVLVLALAAGLPVAAARAGCVCEHGHDGAAMAAAGSEKPHVCTPACTADTCPMHRAAARAAAAAHAPHQTAGRTADAMRCGCAGEAQALIGQAAVSGVLPALVSFDAPLFARPARTTVAEAPLSLAASPPAPPPRA